MKKVIIGSENPAKIKATQLAFNACFPNEKFDFIAIKSDSGVPVQPFGEYQTLKGARNRINFIRKIHPDADYFIGPESGVIDNENQMYVTAFIVIENQEGNEGISKTASFLVPQRIAEVTRKGEELALANDKFFGTTNSKQKSGMIGILTEGIIDRTNLYFQATVIALMQVKNKRWYRS